MIALTAYLILAHLLGDFVFQPTKLVIWKNKSKWGLAVHILIHLLVTLIILSPFIIAGNTWLLGLAVSILSAHFLIDQIKITYDSNKKHKNKLKPFLLDQLMHFSIIILAIFLSYFLDFQLLTPQTGSIYYLSELPIYLSVLILITNALEIYHYERDLTRQKKHHVKFVTIDALLRVSIVTVVFFLYLLMRY